MSDAPNPRWTPRDWVIIIGAVGGLGIGLINAWHAKGRDETLQVIETNTNSSLTELRLETQVMRKEISDLKVERATSQERQNPTEADGSAK